MTTYEGDKIPDFSTFLYWFITTLSTVGYGDISPSTPQGRRITMLLMVLGITLYSLVAGTLISGVLSLKQKTQRGYYHIVKKNHILILGYNPLSTPRMVEEIIADKTHKDKIVLVSDAITENPLAHAVDFVYGDIADEAILIKASIEAASSILISGQDDNETLTACVVANTLINSNAHVIAHVSDPSRARHIQNISPAIVVIVARVAEAMIQELQDPGTCGLFSDLLSNSKSQTCYRIEVGAFEGTFGQITAALKSTFDILPIAIWSDEENESLENPSKDYPVKPGDLLYVIAPQRPLNLDWSQLS